jgi:hypothetical protein
LTARAIQMCRLVRMNQKIPVKLLSAKTCRFFR